MSETSLRLYATEATAKKAGQHLCSFEGGHVATTLYALRLPGEKRPTYLLSTTYRLAKAEQRWIAEHGATVTKLGRFPAGSSFIPLQLSMVRSRKPAE